MTDTVFVVEPRHIVSIDVHRVIDEAAPATGDTITPTRLTWRGTVTLRVRFRPNRHIELAGRTYRIRSCFDDRDRFGPGVYTYRIEEARPCDECGGTGMRNNGPETSGIGRPDWFEEWPCPSCQGSRRHDHPAPSSSAEHLGGKE